MSERCYYQTTGEGLEMGPLPIEKLRAMQQRGELPPMTMIRSEGEGQPWKPLISLGKVRSAKPLGVVGTLLMLLLVGAMGVLLYSRFVQVTHKSAGSSHTMHSMSAEALYATSHTPAGVAGYRAGQSYGRLHPGPNDPLVLAIATREGGGQSPDFKEQAHYTWGYMDGYQATRSAAK